MIKKSNDDKKKNEDNTKILGNQNEYIYNNKLITNKNVSNANIHFPIKSDIYGEEQNCYNKNINNSNTTRWKNELNKEKINFYLFFNSPKNYNFQINNLCSSLIQNEYHDSLNKYFSTIFQPSNDDSSSSLKYDNEQIKIYVDYIYDAVNYALQFFNTI